jgi:hypothetical protein
MRVTPGTIFLAQTSGAVIMPMAASVSRRWMLSSWDRFIVPLPFARGLFTCGAPVAIARDASPGEIEAARRLLEERMNALCRELDARLGLSAIDPAPIASTDVRTDSIVAPHSPMRAASGMSHLRS